MDLKILLDTPPWDWPRNAAKTFHKILIDPRATASDRLVAAELAGDFTVINNDLAAALLTIVQSAGEAADLRARAAISLGPVLEHADTAGFDDPEDVPISQRMFRNIQDSLQKLFADQRVPKEVRRRIMEASVRASENWHQKAIETAYASGDQEWMLTAVFSMRWVRGLDRQILEALQSADPEIHYEAVQAAGNWELDAAWPHVIALVNNARTPKGLLIAAIGAAGSIRPREAGPILVELADSDDKEIAEAAREAMSLAGMTGEEDDEEDEEEEEEASGWVN